MGWVIGALKHLAESVRAYLEQDLCLPLAYSKFGIASSSGPMLKLARDALQDLAGVPDGGDVKNLGIDFSGGQHRRRPGASRTRAKRWATYDARRKRMKKA